MKYDVKGNWRRLFQSPMRVALALVVVALLLVPVAVQADLKATAVVYAFDIDQTLFQNSLVIVAWDGSWVPFLHELNFDTDLWPDDELVVQTDPAQCLAAGGTRWAGNMYYGLYYVDDKPLGGLGFQESRNWSLISCDRNGDGSWDGGDLDYDETLPEEDPPLQPSPYDRGEWRGLQEPPLAEPWGPYTECTTDGTYCRVLSQDEPMWCSTGNCLAEIVTTIQVNLDLDCDGVVDDLFPVVENPNDPPEEWHPEMLCFYAEARTPKESDYDEQPILPTPEPGEDPVVLPLPPMPTWAGNPQARISTVGGEKTVNFKITVITAVELASFDATPQGNGVLLTWETASEVDNLGFNIYRADSQVGELIKINPNLIPSKDLGGSMGAAYSFLDESAVPGATYYYWLEDLDMSGGSAKHGPVTAEVDAAKVLPGRPRPAPMPDNAF